MDNPFAVWENIHLVLNNLDADSGRVDDPGFFVEPENVA